MSGFSNLIDISSFFIGILINLLLVALICYYFKRKIDNLEVAQSEQAKMLYTIISQQETKLVDNTQNEGGESMGMLQNLNLEQLSGDYNGYEESNNYIQSGENVVGLMTVEHDDGDDESESESESESENEDNTNVDSDEDTILAGEDDNQVEDVNTEEVVEDVKSIKYNIDEDLEQVYDYEKMTVKELKTIADNMGIQNIKKNVKKQDLINILVTQSNQNQQINFVKNDESVIEQEEEEAEEIVDVDDVVEEPIVVHQEDSDEQDEGLVIELDEDEDINIGNDNEELIS